MAITTQSFRLNPRLLLVAALATLGMWSSVHVLGLMRTAPLTAQHTCRSSVIPMERWSPRTWGQYVLCVSAAGDGVAAYQAATVAVGYHPTDATLLNLKGFVAARNGDHSTAVYDFRTGQRVTGSPSGVFENNIAWTTLFQTAPLSTDRAERVLLQTRVLYERSLEKKWSCERAHTALYVEYAMADLIAHNSGPDDQRVKHAIDRYVRMYERYMQCFNRAALGDELVVEELISAAAMDAEMGRIAGISNPTRHLNYEQAAIHRGRELGLKLNREWCIATIPVARAANHCAELF